MPQMIEHRHEIYQRRYIELAQLHKLYHSNHSIVYSCQYSVGNVTLEVVKHYLETQKGV
jgi:hypothetical protein